MAFTIKHKFASVKSDGIDTSLVQPSNWNDTHDIVMDAYTIVGRASGSGAASGLPWSTFQKPVGDISIWPSNVLPDATYLFLRGQDISRVVYADLFTLFGTTFGVGDGSTTFTLPNLMGRVVAGKENSATLLTAALGGVDGATLAAVGGSQGVTLTAAKQASMPLTVSGNTGAGATFSATGGAVLVLSSDASGTLVYNGALGLTVSGTADGGGGAHENVQPTIIMNFIIKALKE